VTHAPPAPHAHGFDGLAPCVHCGFCLPACPTYEVTSDEAESPRGRIVLMQALARGTMSPADPDVHAHLDRCLGCRGCETVCPSGVLFGPALESARAMIAAKRPLPFALRAALWILARPSRQRLLWMLSRLLRATGLPRALARGTGPGSPTLGRMMGMLAASAPTAGYRIPNTGYGPESSFGIRYPVSGIRNQVSVLFRGCVMDGLFSHVHDATIDALAANGIGVAEVTGQVCCGALAAHAGAHDLAKSLARENVAAFGRTTGTIVVNSAGCGAMLRSYGALFADDDIAEDARRVAARVRDVTEVLADAGPRPGTRDIPLRVAYDAPCHLLHGQGVAAPPLRVLAAIPGLALVPLEGADRCCGAAGLYSMIEPAMSEDVLAHKLDAIRAAAPDLVATGNPGCLMQIGAGALLEGMDVRVVHPVELLAWSYRA
jgi:glycolate oxidase iron-sulfur subunit